VLLSGNLQSENVVAEENFKQQCYLYLNNLSFRWPVLLSGNNHSEHVAAVESFQTTILSEPQQLLPL